MLIFQGVIWPENVETHYLCLEDDMEDVYQFLAEWFMYTIHGCYWNRFFVNVLTTIYLLSNSTRWAPTTYKYVYTSTYGCSNPSYPFICPEIPTTIKTMGVNITTIAYLRVLIIGIGSTIILMVVEAQGNAT